MHFIQLILHINSKLRWVKDLKMKGKNLNNYKKMGRIFLLLQGGKEFLKHESKLNVDRK